MNKFQIYEVDDPPLDMAVDMLYKSLIMAPRRLAFAGRAGAGKTTLCELISGTSALLDYGKTTAHPPVPIINHADGIKEEVLEWVATAKTRGLIPGHRSTFEAFCDFLGVSPGIVERDMWEITGELWEAMNQLLEDAYESLPSLAGWTQYPAGTNIPAKVAFVDSYKPLFRTALQLYGQATKDLAADPYYWVERTVTRGLEHRLCVNGDTRFTEEMQVLRNTGWTAIYLNITDDTQRQRRPELTPAQLAHISENGMKPNDCDIIIDANQRLGKVVTDVIKFLNAVPQVRV